MGVISFVSLLLFKIRHSLILYGEDDITQVQPPNRHYQVVVRQSADWDLLRRAAILAYRRAREEWGEEFCRTLCYWLENTSFIFVFHAWTDDEGECTGMTVLNYPPKPVIHIALYDSNGKPRTIRQIAATLLHEIMHLREIYQHLPNYPDLCNLQQQIREALIECEVAGYPRPRNRQRYRPRRRGTDTLDHRRKRPRH